MVERPPQREGPAQRNGPERRLEANAAAKGGRHADRSAGVRAEGTGAEARHHGDRRTAARAAWAAPGIVGIAGDAPPRIGGADAVGELVEIGFSKDNGAGSPKPGHRVGVPGRDPVPQNARPDRRSLGPRREQVLDRNRHSQQRSDLAPRQSPLGSLRLPPSPLAGERDVGTQAHGPLDPPGVRVRQFDGRRLSPAQLARDLNQGC